MLDITVQWVAAQVYWWIAGTEVVDTEVVCLGRPVCIFAEDVVALSIGERGTGFQLLLVLHPNFRVWTVLDATENLKFATCYLFRFASVDRKR